MDLSNNIFELICIIIGSGIATGLGTAMFQTYIQDRRRLKNQLDVEKTIAQYQMQVEDERRKHEKEMEIFKLQLSQQKEIKMASTNTNKKATEFIYRIRNTFRNTIENWNIDQKKIDENQIEIDKLIQFLLTDRFYLELSGVFVEIHRFKQRLITFQDSINDLKYLINGHDNKKINVKKERISSLYKGIDKEHSRIIQKLAAPEKYLLMKSKEAEEDLNV